jgi:hypothetical protein
MSWGLIGFGDEQVVRSGLVGGGVVPCAVRGLVVYKRSSSRAPLVSVAVASAYRCGGRWSRSGALFEVAGVGGSL